MAMAEYNIISIEHKPGSSNKIADALSRIKMTDKTDTIDNIVTNILALNVIANAGAKIESTILTKQTVMWLVTNVTK